MHITALAAAANAETRLEGDFTILNAAKLSICAMPIALALIYSKSIRTNSAGRGEERPLYCLVWGIVTRSSMFACRTLLVLLSLLSFAVVGGTSAMHILATAVNGG